MKIGCTLAAAFALSLPSIAYAAAPPVEASRLSPASVADYLRATSDRDKSIRYSLAAIPRTPYILVYLQGPTVCGSGGCSLLVLRPTKSSYRAVRTIQIVNRPILYLGTKAGAGPTIGVWVQGGGIRHGREVAISPIDTPRSANPSLSRTVVRPGAGKVLIGENDRGVPLFN